MKIRPVVAELLQSGQTDIHDKAVRCYILFCYST